MQEKTQRKRQPLQHQPRRTLVWIAVAAAVIAGGVALAYGLAAAPVPALYVKKGSEQLWRRIIGTQNQWQIVAYKAAAYEAELEKNDPHGIAASKCRMMDPRRNRKPEGFVYILFVHAGMYRGAIVLSVNPWMVFRKTATPAFIRERVKEKGGADGLLLLAGAANKTVHAWASQLS
ncbi:MAG: hypothetical protein LBD58_09025 [Treponema sp.]|nr:hypothetical protein [Treponema sp.]